MKVGLKIVRWLHLFDLRLLGVPGTGIPTPDRASSHGFPGVRDIHAKVVAIRYSLWQLCQMEERLWPPVVPYV